MFGPDVRRVVNVARADFKQRIRSRRLLAVLALLAYLGYMVTVGDVELVYQDPTGPDSFDNYQGVNTAAWVGVKAALTGAFFLGVVGFYVFKDTLARDRSTGVGRLVATTPVRDRELLLGKWLSNVALGTVLVAVLGGATVLNHAVHGVGATNPLRIVGPPLLLAVPVAAIVGAVALLFESNRWLDGTLGNAVYFVAVISVPTVLLGTATANGVVLSPTKYLDLFGMTAVYSATYDGVASVAPDYAGGVPSFGQIFGESETFVWTGGGWPAWVYAQRLAMVPVGAALAVAGVAWFDRYTPTASDGSGWLPTVSLRRPAVPIGGDDTDGGADRGTDVGGDVDSSAHANPHDVALTPVDDRDAGGFRRLYLAELRMALRGQRWWWYAGVLAVLVAGVAGSVSPSAARRFLYPLALVWPVFVWSSLGARPARNGTLPFVVSSRRPVAQLFAEWAAGVTVGVVVFGGVLATLLTAGQSTALVGVLAAVTFPPALAVAAGVWSETNRLFEIGYLTLWYAGPLNGVPHLDFAGVTEAGVHMGTPDAALGATVALLGLAVVRRRRRTR